MIAVSLSGRILQPVAERKALVVWRKLDCQELRLCAGEFMVICQEGLPPADD